MTTTAKVNHTPGPWSVVEYGDDESPSLVIHSDAENRVCFLATPGSVGDPEKIEANARLIAAAPELLEAARVALGHLTCGMDGDWRGEDDPREILRAAIAKAEGTEQ